MLEDAAARAVKHPGASERDDLALRFHESIAQMIAGTCHKIREGTLLDVYKRQPQDQKN